VAEGNSAEHGGVAADGRMTADDVQVTWQREGNHAVVVFSRPPHNYFSLELLDTIAATLEELAGTGWCRAAVLASNGKHFCAGADLGVGADRRGDRHVYDAALRLFEQPLPLVVAVQGSAIGGGLGLALAADFRVASPTSRFVANFTRLGFHPGFGLTVTLPAAIGQQAAWRLLLGGGAVDGTRAAGLGLCEAVVDESDLRAKASELAAEIVEASPLGIRDTRRTLRRVLLAEVAEALAIERAAQDRLVATKDFREGVRAARERRPPQFRGS